MEFLDPCSGVACLVVAWLVVRHVVTTKYVNRGDPDYFASAFPSEEDSNAAERDARSVDAVFAIITVSLVAWRLWGSR